MVENPEPLPDVDVAGALRAAFKARTLVRSEPQGYEVHGEIARGGMGVIMHAFDRGLTRQVALKVLRDEHAQEPRFVQRFVDEARITARLDHPGIVPIYAAGQDPAGRAYFAMRLVRGRDLRQIIELANADQGGWSQARALSVFLKVCEAMAYAHERGVLHRDLKPSNVMVGEFGEVYVMDWGLARVIGRDDAHDLRLRDERGAAGIAPVESPIVTVDGEVLGTPCYMSPEQALGRLGELGPASDIYSVGAMLYHLLAGEMPYVPAGTKVASRTVLEEVAKGPPRRLHETRALPAELVAICERAMAREPARRYASMLAFAEDLRAFLERRVVSAYETGAWAEAKKWVRRNRALASALAAVVAALAVGLIVSLSLKSKSDSNFARAERSAQLASEERDRAMVVGSFLEDVLNGVGPSVALGRDTTMLREMMDKARSRIESGELSAAPEAEARLMLVIGIAFQRIGEYEAAEPMLTRAVEHAERLEGTDDRLFAQSLIELAELQYWRGDLGHAEPLARRAVDMRKQRVARDPTNAVDRAALAENLQVLGSILQVRGDPPSAEALIREALEIHERLYPGDRHEVAVNLHNLAVVLVARSELEEAQTYYERALAMLERLHPRGHPQIPATLDSFGVLVGFRGDPARAEELQSRALEMRRRLLPAGHPDIGYSLNNLASTLQGRGDLAGAETHLREVVEIYRRKFQGDHPVLALAITNLAAILHMRGDLAGAEPLYREAHAMQRRLFPGDHPDTPYQMNNLAQLLRARDDLDGAESLLREAVEMQRRLAQGDHPEVALLAQNLARVLEARGELAEAESSYRAALRMYGALGKGYEGKASVAAAELGQLLMRQERFADADEVLRAGVSKSEGNSAAASSFKRCVELLAQIHTEWERVEPDRGHAEQASVWKQRLDELDPR